MGSPSPASHCLEICDDGRRYKFRSTGALRAVIGLTPPYSNCLAYAPRARNAPHCARPVNRARAASVDSLLAKFQETRIPSMAAENLLETLSTHAVCGITGWHRNKAAEVYFSWQHDLWDECLRVNGLDPRQWDKPVPSMLGWDRALKLAWQEQGWNTEEDADDDSEEGEDAVSLTGESIADSDAPSDFGGQGDISFDFDDGHSLSEVVVATPDTTVSSFDGPSSDFYPSTSSQYSSTGGVTPDSHELSTGFQEAPSHNSGLLSLISAHQPTTNSGSVLGPINQPPVALAADAGAMPDESNVQDEITESSADEFASHLLAINEEILREPNTASGSALMSDTPRPGPPAGFRLYPQAPSPMSQLKQLLNLMTQTVSPQRRYAGVIYGFMRPSAPGILKIGVVKDRVVAGRPFADPVDHRLATWRDQCGYAVVEVFRRRIACAAAERIESLVHLALRQYRLIEDPPCRRCEGRRRAVQDRTGGRRGGGKHNEWFKIDAEAATRAVELWAAFAEQLPYDGFGRLVDFWSAKVEAAILRITPDETVESWQETIPQLVEERRRTELADLLNRLYI